MKMTEVITRFREVNPGVQESATKLAVGLDKVVDLVKDADMSRTEEGRKALVSALMIEALSAKMLYGEVMKGLAELDEAIRSYTRKFESGAVPKDDPDQPMLPGMEAEDGEHGVTEENREHPSGGDFVPQEA